MRRKTIFPQAQVADLHGDFQFLYVTADDQVSLILCGKNNSTRPKRRRETDVLEMSDKAIDPHPQPTLKKKKKKKKHIKGLWCTRQNCGMIIVM
jgi:hypothetical protein